ncbi:outer membrane lipoprotein LolB [Janthinobacterium fluminis]|uniref:outer membrane lipoprotein LolB n=1 Tax=Janthinobacterium fluminis TaxID=2987524 RepID=UPI0030790A5F
MTTAVPPSAQPVAPYRDSVELAGRLMVNYQRDDKPESLSGKFVWQQRGERVDVSLASPLGSTIATIAVAPGLATLTQAGQAPRAAADVDALSAQALGWPLPVSGLRDWLQGYAVGADGGRFVASPLHASVTTRDGWRLNFVSWQDGAGAPRPKRIDAERAASLDSAAVAIRIVIVEEQP